MPAVFEDSDDSQQQVADIVAFLQSLPISQQVSNDSSGSVEFAASQTDGEKLFETLGCLGCHDFREPSLNDSYDRVSLYYVNSKYPDDALINFLSNPHAYDTGSSMPDFHLKPHEANSLAMYLREQSFGILDPNQLAGDAVRGKQLFAKVGCAQCHLTSDTRMAESYLSWKNDNQRQGCLSATAPGPGVPHYQFSDEERASLRNLLANDLPSLNVSHASETSDRLVNSLRCASCHDRDGVRSSRPLIIAEEGSGLFPEVLPDLTQAGEKFHADWTKKLLKGEAQKPRPWISSRMPSFESYADALANGMAAEHAIAFESRPKLAVDAQLAEVGEQLTRQTGLDCRQCHAIGDLQPRGDKETQVALGINFEIIRERLRGEAYHRFMLDPPRYEANTKMIRLSENGLTTKLKVYFDADARQQFNAIWHYIQSLPLR
jgi:cytochrome c551/c552